jgi:hypothetical protein
MGVAGDDRSLAAKGNRSRVRRVPDGVLAELHGEGRAGRAREALVMAKTGKVGIAPPIP